MADSIGNIQIDPALLDSDYSDYESSGYDTGTESLTSSINDYLQENGRRYHTYFGVDKNVLPTDELEQDRLDIHHEIFLQLLGGRLHLAPLNAPQRILDIGTGTGLWAIDVADTYPSAEVIGTDLSPIQPNLVPPNCKFEVDDAEKDFTFASDLFDFIHVRNLAQGISDWPRLMDQIYRCTKPGGYVELADVGCSTFSDDGSMEKDNPISLCFEAIGKGMTKIGRPPAQVAKMKEHLENAGFIDIKAISIKQPLGPWAKDKRLKLVGAMNLLNGETAFHAYGMAVLTRIVGMSQEDADEMCTAGSKGCRNKNWHLYNYFYVVYGRKPEDN